MFVVVRPCPHCGVQQTVNMSDGRPLCVNCTLLRVPSTWSRAQASRHEARSTLRDRRRSAPDLLEAGARGWYAVYRQ